MKASIPETSGDAIPPSKTPLKTPPAWSVIGFTFSNRNTNSELMLRESYLFFLRVAEEFELDGVTVEDFWDWIVEPLLPLFRQLPSPDKTRQRTLDDFCKPETFVYTLRAVSDELTPEQYESGIAESGFGLLLADELCASWTCFSTSEVRVCEEKTVGPPSHTPRKVLLNDGTVAFFKLMHRGDKGFLKRVLNTYKKIDEALLDNTTRVPRLRGLVQDDSGVVFGLLLTYIDCKRLTLSCAVKPQTPMALREKWAAQLRDTTNQLHDAGIVWGDAKPDNVLIDRDQDAWITDFGGGYTEGWVPKTLAETVEGDELALGKIVKFVRI